MPENSSDNTGEIRESSVLERMQNTSHAVMAQRSEPKTSLDDFPTPPWATRALVEHIIRDPEISSQSCLEPACNRGFMSFVLEEYFGEVTSSDIFDYGYGQVQEFLGGSYQEDSFDWVVTNPPFKMAEDFFFEARRVARVGVALLTRTVFIESVGRYNRLFSKYPPTYFAQFSERVPMVKGRIDKKASTATGYSWLLWDLRQPQIAPQLTWVPPCRKSLELDGDYDLPVRKVVSKVKPEKKSKTKAKAAGRTKAKTPKKTDKPNPPQLQLI